jgi:hypothetical protein
MARVILTHGGELMRGEAIVVCFRRLMICRKGLLVRFRRSTRAPHLHSTRFLLAAIALAAMPHQISRLDLLQALWGDQEDGGPDADMEIIRKYCNQLRADLAFIGLHIGGTHAPGLLMTDTWRDAGQVPHARG